MTPHPTRFAKLFRRPAWPAAILSALALLAHSPAPAQQRPPVDAAQLVGRLDRNGDGGLSRDEVPERMQRLRDNFARLDFNGDGRITAAELQAVARTRRTAPTTGKQARAPSRPATTAAPAATGAEAIDRRMNQAIADQVLPGAVVLFIHQGEIVFERAYGWADIEAGREQRIEDLFNLGSTSKPLAMSAVISLVADGKLELDRTIEPWYPRYGGLRLADGTAVERVPTVREMMTHTSGTFANRCGRRIDLRLLYMFGHTLAESADAIARQPLVAAPGASFCYCGPSMQVLARIAERITGDDFDRLAERAVFAPLGMNDTFYRTDEDLSDRIAVIYEQTGAGLARAQQNRNPQGDPFILAPGGVFSTAHDLARFVRMHLNDGELDGKRILPAGLVREMRRNQIGARPVDLGPSAALGEIESYGLGWLLDDVDEEGQEENSQARLFSHGGAFGTYIWGDVQTGLGAVLLTQIALAEATPVWNDVLAIARATWPEGQGQAAIDTTDWQPEVVRIGQAGRHYLDPELHPELNLMTFQDAFGTIWLAGLAPDSGLFQSADGLDTLMDSGALPLLDSFNGPEFGIDANGWSVYYTKPGASVPQVWRARLDGGTPVAAPLLDDGQRRQSVLAGKNPLAPSTRLVYLHGDLQSGGDFFHTDTADPAGETRVVRLNGVDSPRWIDATAMLVFAESDGADAGQLKLIDTQTGSTRTITNDAGVKSFAFGWRAPDFGDLLVLALIDDQAVGIWRDTGGAFWERIATLTPPPESNYTIFGSPEPLVANGKSYISLVLKNDTALGFTDGEVWVMGIEPDPALRFARRVDDGASPVKRSDPESMIGESEVFIYYNAVGANGINEIHRARTGLATTAPDGVASELIDPVLTDPAIRPLSELPDAGNRNLSHFVARNRDQSNGWLFIELSGSGGLPHDNQQVLLLAARLGLRAIGLAYPNWPSVTELTFESGDLDIPAEVRIERLYGIDASPLVEVDPANSVVNRLVRLLEYLDGIYPNEGWGSFLRGTAGAREPDWPRIVIGGHSQGAGHVAYLAGEVKLAGGILFGGPGDFVQGLGPANWLLRPLVTPGDRLFGFVHAFDPLYGAFQISQGILGLDQFGPVQDIDDLAIGAMASHQYDSDLAPVPDDNFHNAVVVDANLPLDTNGQPAYLNVWTRMLGEPVYRSGFE